MKKSGTVIRRDQSDSPAARHLPLVDILVDAQAELQALVVASGLKVLEAMLEEDRVAVCGPRYTHQPHRRASRAGHAPSEVVLGGRKVAIRRPRVRRDGREVALPSVAAFTDTDPLNRRVVEQMLIGVATRQYDRSLEPLGADVRTRGTSKSAVSRRFVAQTQAQLDAWRATPLDDLDLVALLIDGVQVGGHCIVVALGIDQTGRKHALGLWEGSTENTTVCQGLLTNLHSRGLRTDRSLLVILDGAKALHTAVTQTFGPAALVQRCQVHKRRNVLEYLPEAQRVWVKAILTRAYTRPDVKAARRLLHDLARRLDADYPSAAASVREGLDETLTVIGLGALRAPPTIAGHDECGRESPQPHPAREAQREALARGRDGPPVGRRWRVGSRQRVSAAQGLHWCAAARRGASCARRQARSRGFGADGCVVVNRVAAEFQQRTGQPHFPGPPQSAGLVRVHGAGSSFAAAAGGGRPPTFGVGARLETHPQPCHARGLVTDQCCTTATCQAPSSDLERCTRGVPRPLVRPVPGLSGHLQ